MAPHPHTRLSAFCPAKYPAGLAFLLALLLLAGCQGTPAGKNGKKEQKKRSIPVAAETVTAMPLPVILTATGYVEAYATVQIRSQVPGVLKTVHFAEGAAVKKGDLLFTIDPRPYEAMAAKAEAASAKDKAELENARRELERYAQAAKKGFVSTEQADQAATKVSSLTAMVKADQAALDAARLELEYCSIRSPLDGQAGEIFSDQGNVIKANADTPMVTINQMQPVLVAFTVPGKHLLAINTHRAKGELQVQTSASQPAQPALGGALVFIDNTVDPATGVLRLKASFDNTQRLLWPGQMVDITLQLTTKPDCTVVPSQAVQIGQNEAYVYVVKDNQSVMYRPVRTGILHEGKTEILEDLQPGELVVTDGQMQLADGTAVEIRASKPAGAKGPAQAPEKVGGEKARGKQ